ncbi:MAG: entericidin A/B family lipoprotein [Candidatus Competibacteraceae bacterium]|nr:MAG: entericidin A/B family lipoprotein [Candidatus Competibacteraceae bacterium]
MRLSWVALLGLAVVHLNACNTVKGAGQDIKALGTAIERKAEQKKHD